MRFIFTDGPAYKKPVRKCPFCNMPQSRLLRHIVKKHSDIPQIPEVLKVPTEGMYFPIQSTTSECRNNYKSGRAQRAR